MTNNIPESEWSGDRLMRRLIQNPSAERLNPFPVVQAVLMNDVVALRAALASNHSPNDTPSDQTALLMAVGRQLPEVFAELLEAPEIDLSARNRLGFSAADLLALNGSQEMLEKLFDKNPLMFSARNGRGTTPIILAAEHGNWHVVNFLAEKFPRALRGEVHIVESNSLHSDKDEKVLVLSRIKSLSEQDNSSAAQASWVKIFENENLKEILSEDWARFHGHVAVAESVRNKVKDVVEVVTEPERVSAAAQKIQAAGVTVVKKRKFTT